MCNCDCPPTDIHTKKLLKIRSPHKCVECGELMPKGTMMHRVTTLIEGYFDRHYTCLDCEAIVEYLTKIEPKFCYCYGELVQTLIQAHSTKSRDMETDAKDENIPSAIEGGGLVRGEYSIYRLNVPWLTPRIGGKFKLAIERIERQEIALIVQ